MTAIDVPGLYCDDITFCWNHCERTDCPRNSCNIRDRNVPHSYTKDVPSDCPKQDSSNKRQIVEERIGDTVVELKERGNGTYLVVVKEKAGDWPLKWEIDDDGYRMCKCMWSAAYDDALATFNEEVMFEKNKKKSRKFEQKTLDANSERSVESV